jgi:hypothetical protein
MDALALPLVLVLQEHRVFATAANVRAHNFAIRPTQINHVFMDVLRVSEVLNCFLESSGLLHNGLTENRVRYAA